MGQSASAYLAFGFELPEELPDVFNGNDSFDDGITIAPFGYDYAGKFVSICTFKAYWEGPQYLATLPERPSFEKIQALSSFCKKYGIEYQEPGWYLMAHFA